MHPILFPKTTIPIWLIMLIKCQYSIKLIATLKIVQQRTCPIPTPPCPFSFNFSFGNCWFWPSGNFVWENLKYEISIVSSEWLEVDGWARVATLITHNALQISEPSILLSRQTMHSNMRGMILILTLSGCIQLTVPMVMTHEGHSYKGFTVSWNFQLV